MEITIDSPELTSWAKRIGRAKTAGRVLMREYVIKATATYKASIDMKVPVRTGALRSTLRGRTSDLEGTVTTASKYGMYVEKGTSAHWIYPSTKQALSWVGAQHPVRAVYHPGTKGTHFFENGVYEAIPAVAALQIELMTKLKEVVR